jgi:hypothetical protein
MNSIDRTTYSTNYKNGLKRGLQTDSSPLVQITLTLSVLSLLLLLLVLFPISHNALAQIQSHQPLKQGQVQQLLPNIHASNIY